MRHGVVAEGVAAPGDLADEARMGGGFATDDKESGAGVRGIEQVEQARGVLGSGPSSMVSQTASPADEGRRESAGPHQWQPGTRVA
jgi:hypothetical protein